MDAYVCVLVFHVETYRLMQYLLEIIIFLVQKYVILN